MFAAYVAFAAIAGLDLVPLIRKRMWRDVIAWSLMFLPALTITILMARRIQVPSIMELIGNALKAAGLSY